MNPNKKSKTPVLIMTKTMPKYSKMNFSNKVERICTLDEGVASVIRSLGYKTKAFPSPPSPLTICHKFELIEFQCGYRTSNENQNN